MKKVNMLLLAVIMTALLSNAHAQITIPAKLQKSIQPNKLPADITIPADLLKKDIDLSANAINFSVVTVKDRFNARVKIEGVVKNVGRLQYQSGAGQQSVFLYEESGGAPRLVASQSFQNVPVGGTVKISYTRHWNKSSPAEGEFPPTYRLVIGFDPDLYIDGNTNNDDSNSANNKLSKSGSDINGLPFKR